MSNSSLSVLLVDDHPVVRAGYRRLLESNGLRVVEAGSGEEAYRLFCAEPPDVVVMDLNMPGMGGMETSRRMLARDPGARILVFSVHDNEAMLNQATKVGVLGYLTKRCAAQDMVSAVHRVAQGKRFVDPDLVHLVMTRSNDGNSPLDRLTPREFEVFRLLAEGHSVNQIAEILCISPKTAGVHHTHVMQKLEVKSPVQLVRIAIRHGITRI